MRESLEALQAKNKELTRDLNEARQQQTATADVLRVISRSSFDLKTVLDTLSRSARTLCNATECTILLRDGDVFRAGTAIGERPDLLEFLKQNPRELGRRSVAGRVGLSGMVVQVPDVLADPEFDFPGLDRVTRARAHLGVPLLREGRVEGVFVLSRPEPGAFTDRQVDLIQTFADQAVIAIENVRLFEQVEARTREVTEALQQQTATADVLKVISRSTFDLPTVLDTLTQSAAELCDADRGSIFQRDGDAYRPVTSFQFSPEWVAYGKLHPIAPSPHTVTGRVLLERRTVHHPDVLSVPNYAASEYQRIGHYRSILGVPLLREGEPIGVFILTRDHVRPFTERQIEIVQSFADQAVIAIENVRLFEEVEARTREVTEALQQQTATADVLKVISRSAFDLRTVLATLVQSAMELCNAPQGVIFLRIGDILRPEMQLGFSREFEQFMQDTPLKVSRASPMGRAAHTGSIAHTADVLDDPDFRLFEAQKIGGFRATLGVPLKRDDKVVGVFGLSRPVPEAFTDREIELVETFADQAVIAIENVRLFEEVEARTREVTEALQQQTATADVLKVISRSTFDLQTVLDTLVESAARYCDADRACIFRREGDLYECVSNFGFSPEYIAYVLTHPFAAGSHSATGRVALEGRAVHILDVLADPHYGATEHQRLGKYRTLLGVPLLREGAPIGVFILARDLVRPFVDRQIEIVETFADQAVIAIENVRLFSEVEARTREVTEALQQQTATAEVLKVISRSAFDLKSVLRALARSATELCAGQRCVIYLRDGDVFRFEEQYGATPEAIEFIRDRPFRPARDTVVGRAALSASVVNVADVWADRENVIRAPGGARAMMGVPLLRDGDVLGVFTVVRFEPIGFTDRQVELIQTFADQAVIAIENVRLFQEVQARTRDLSEALDFQTATSDVLNVISRSPSNLQPVLDTIVETAHELCRAKFALFFKLAPDGLYHLAASKNADVSFLDWLQSNPIGPGDGTATGLAALQRCTIHLHDALADPRFTDLRRQQRSNARTQLAVPLMRADAVIGIVFLARTEVEPFTEKQVNLVTTFADQAVIAINNVGLFEEVQARTRDLTEALQQQTATADVLKVISRSAFGLKTVLQTLIDSAVRLCATDGSIYLRQGDVFLAEAAFDADPERLKARNETPRRPGRGSIVSRVALSGSVEQIPDNLADSEFVVPLNQRFGKVRALLGVPLLRDGQVDGVFVLGRPEPGLFTERQIDLVRTFADQAVIAIENVRLFEQVQARTNELARSLDELRSAQTRLVQSEKLASLGQLTAGIAHEIKNPLNFVNNFSSLSGDLIDELRQILERAPLDEGTREEVDELTKMLKGNLSKVVQHGKRADSIVKNMLLHSREGSGEHRPVDVNALVDESMNLAYHGARAEKPGFNVTLEKEFDPTAGEVDLYPQEITRVLLNLISNGFYAASKRKAEGGDPAFEPTVAAATHNLGEMVEIRIRDNGNGIPEEVKAKMFNPFFTTKPAGEGTGLGLSLSHDIIVKQHGGTIDVATCPGKFTEFTIVLPRRGSFGSSSKRSS